MSALQELQNYTFVSKYARWLEDKNRRETWKEAVDRVRNMMHTKYDGFGISEDIDWAYDIMYKKKVLGSQRALQFGGDPILKRHAKIYNCFHKDTKFVSSEGIVSFAELSNGQEITVLTHTGMWKKAEVVNGGIQELIEVTISRHNSDPIKILTTSGHDWIIDGTLQKKQTKELNIGDELLAVPDIFNDFDYDNALPDERLYWAYGYVYGDGTKVKYKDGTYKYSMVRLCGDQIKYKYRFEELGFKNSSSLSLNGDFIAYTGTYLKTAPNPETDEPRLIRAFVRGYLDADGELNRNYSKNLYQNIQSSDSDHIEFIRKCFPIAGVFIVSETDLTGQVTNFGTRPYTIKFRIINHIGGKSCAKFKVIDIKNTKTHDEVWCLRVEGDRSFVLENGLTTGNCTASYCDRLRFFQECFWLLLCGSGTGFSVQKHHVAKLPTLEHSPEPGIASKYVIEDSIEGWADALGVLLSSYFSKPIEEFKQYKNVHVAFDYSNIRPKGSALTSGVGKAPGFEPLQKGLEKIRALLDRCVADGQKKLRPIDAYDIVMHSSDAVLSGGVRRSASLALFSADDEEMAKAKTGNWYIENPQRARSNNSALLLKDQTSFEQFKKLMESVKEFGEPGFIWSDSTEMVFNPCVEISLWPVNEKNGKSGFQGCNLSTINCSSIVDENDFYERCKAAALIGTLQAGFTKLDYLGKDSEEIFEREALLGVSMTGIMEKHELILTEKVLKQGAKIAVETNKIFAKKININQAARVTCLKPEGTSSSMLGTSSGIHPHHAKRYIRHVQANILEAPYQHFKKINPQACEKSSWSANNTDEVVKFPIEVPDGAKLKNQLPAVEMLAIVKETQKNWVQSGKNRSLCTQEYLSHNVSNTVTVKPDEWDDVTKYIYDNRKYFAGISLIPQSGDKDYPQAPFTTVYTSREIVKEYGDAALWCSGLIELGLNAFDNNLWAACDYVSMNQSKENDEQNKLKFLTKMKNFASKYFDGDIRRLTYCMKDVYNWKIYCDLFDSFKKVDYTQLSETEDNTVGIEEISCAGGACLI